MASNNIFKNVADGLATRTGSIYSPNISAFTGDFPQSDLYAGDFILLVFSGIILWKTLDSGIKYNAERSAISNSSPVK